jgi:hypothetical protein
LASPRKSRTTIRSFRVDEAALEVIEEDARLKNVSVNTLVNQLLLSYANFERYFTQYPIIKIPSNVFGRSLQGVSDEYARDFGEYLAQNFAKFDILSQRGVLTLETVLDHLQIMSQYSDVYKYKLAEVDGKRTLTLYQRWGRKGSIYFGQYLVSLFEMIKIKSTLTTTDHSVTIVF